jgi:hypothetical protein
MYRQTGLGPLISCRFGELDELALAYATTIHKRQGLEIRTRRDPAQHSALPDAT